MNHDYAHCAEYDPTVCPESCFRAQLVEDYRKRGLGVPVSWMNLRDTDSCPLNKPKPTHGDQIRAMTDEELAKFLSNIRGGCRALTTGSYVCVFYTDNLDTDCKACWIDWLKQESEEG